jgi:hypothetical protein
MPGRGARLRRLVLGSFAEACQRAADAALEAHDAEERLDPNAIAWAGQTGGDHERGLIRRTAGA